jgi:hypothetical protein
LGGWQEEVKISSLTSKAYALTTTLAIAADADADAEGHQQTRKTSATTLF